MKLHELKTNPDVFNAVKTGQKTFEIRLDDRGYEVGDQLLLKQTLHTGEQMKAGMPLEYTGSTFGARITHILRGPIYGLQAGWVILSFR